MVCVGTGLETSTQALELAARYDDVYATVGLHPHDASDLDAAWAGLAALAGAERCVAIGEAGFDLHYEHSPREEQEAAFRRQIQLAKQVDRPLMIHSRNAWDDTFRVLDAEGVPARTIFHCFTGGPDEARAALDRDCYLSFSGIVSFKSADDVRAAAALAPGDRVLVETDSPYLAPVPHRGRPNEPAYVPIVGEALARRARRGCRSDRRAHARERGSGVRRRALTPTQIQRAARHPRAATEQGARSALSRRQQHGRAHRASGRGAAGRSRGGGRTRAWDRSRSRCARPARDVRAVEIDRRLAVALAEVVHGQPVDVVVADALEVDWPALLADHDRWTMVSNLPYNVATPVVMRALETAPMIDRLLVMVQREVGERLAAVPGTKAYGALSVKVAYYAQADVVGSVPPDVFVPKPKVDSALVRLHRHAQPPVSVSGSRSALRARAGRLRDPAQDTAARARPRARP